MEWISAQIGTRADREPAERSAVDSPGTRGVDERRFGQLALDHRRRLYEYLRRRGASPDVAEDCLQEALFRAFRSLGTLRDWDRAPGWLWGIARHVFLDRTRREAVRARPAEAAPEGPPRPDEQLERADLARRVGLAIEELGPPRSEVVDLYYGSGLKVDEIAEALGMPPGTVKTHLFRAREELRRALAGDEEG